MPKPKTVAEGLPKVRRDQLISDANDCYDDDDDDELPATVLPICTNNNNPIAQKLWIALLDFFQPTTGGGPFLTGSFISRLTTLRIINENPAVKICPN